jgi:hypothetical protein
MGTLKRAFANNIRTDGKPLSLEPTTVTAHSPETDLQPVKADITALALREATNESSAAYNLPGQFIDTFTDDTNLGTQTDVDRTSGYMETFVTTTVGADAGGTKTSIQDDNTDQSGASAWGNYGTGSGGQLGTNTADWSVQHIGTSAYLTGDFVLGFEVASITNSDAHTGNAYYQAGLHSTGDTTNGDLYGGNWGAIYAAFNGVGSDIKLIDDQAVINTLSNPFSNAKTYRWARSGSTLYFQEDDATVYTVASGVFNSSAAQWVHFGYGKGSTTRLIGSASDGVYYRSGMSAIKGISTTTTSATGTLIQSANAVGSAKTKVGGTFLYKDNAGTATLGSANDLAIYFTCNGGTNWTEAASYNAITPVYSTGVKQVRLGETTCTGGTDVRYKAVWANQSEGSKETQLHGIGINY